MYFFHSLGFTLARKYATIQVIVVEWMVKMLSLTFYGYPKCGTCRNAKKWLDTHGLTYKEIHIFDSPPSKEELKDMLELSGFELKKFFNTSGEVYRELGLKDKLKSLSVEEMLELLASNGRLIKRPLLTDGKKVTIGYKEEDYAKSWL
jgi:arsenate reductase (glutaredoxin)